MSNSGFSQPIQCSEDVPGQPPSFQTGRAVSVTSGSALNSPNLQTDAERVDQSRPSHGTSSRGATGGGDAAAGSTQDVITIKGEKSTITAKGLAGAMKPGTIFQLGSENHMVVYPGGGHGAYETRPPKIKNKYRITDSQAEPAVKHLDVVSAGLGGDWRRLGRHLGLADAELDQIRMDYHAEGQHEVNYRILLSWKQKSGPVTVQKLAKALAEIGRGDLADELSKG